MSGWWTKYPLPEGWEIKYHWESKRFLYIDHINKTTAWIDPRIELYKAAEEGKLERVNENFDDSSSKTSSEDSSAIQRNKIVAREMKAKNILKKYPEFTMEKIVTLLESNYDNEFSVESKLGQERRNLMEIEETMKKEAEAREKAAAAEREKRAKEEANRRQEEMRKKTEEENRRKTEDEIRRLEEERKKKAMEEAKRIETEKKKEAEELERKKREDEIKKKREEEVKNNLEREMNLKVEEDKINKKAQDKAKESVNHQLPKYEYHGPGCSKELDVSSVIPHQSFKSTLQKGPNRSLTNGSDSRNYKGANRDLLSDRGRSMAKGPDPSNRCGPQARTNVTSA